MFSNLVLRNSRRNRKENGLFFASLVISIVAFYIILSISRQDVMIFLQKMESDAVNRLMAMIPIFYGMTLVILFFLIYFASKFQLERRRHEFGVCLMLGMRRGKLFGMLMAEDFHNSILALAVGLPVAVLLSELISLVTAKAVGMGIVGHKFTLSIPAVFWTMAGFLAIKLAAFLILSGKISRQEVGGLLADTPEGAKKQRPSAVYALSAAAGVGLLAAAYSMAIRGTSWQQIGMMALTLLMGLTGTLLLFYGMGAVVSLLLKREKSRQKLHTFNFRQIQESVIHQSASMAISSLLILAALCCFGAGVAIARTNNQSDAHVLDYTFEDHSSEPPEQFLSRLQNLLEQKGVRDQFSELFEMKIGRIRIADDHKNAFRMEPLMKALESLPESENRDMLINRFSVSDNPYLLCLSDYNKLLELAGKPALQLGADEAAVYMGSDFVNEAQAEILSRIFSEKPEVQIDGSTFFLTGELQTADIVTDRSITILFALIVPDEVFDYYTRQQYSVYVNAVLSEDAIGGDSLMNAISRVNTLLDGAALEDSWIEYESYLQNIGRQLFYMVAASYITIYLAIIFLVIANTVMGVQFLMGQQKTSRRYKTLVRLGASYETLCKSARKQISWYFSLPVAVAAVSSLFGVKALFAGLLASRTEGNDAEMLIISAAMILLLCVVEYIYMTAVKRSSDRYLLTKMVPEREE